MDERDNTGWIVAALTAGTAVLGGLAAVWSRVWKAVSERERSVIEQFQLLAEESRRQYAAQVAETDRLRARLTLHDSHMEEQQGMIDYLYKSESRCRREMADMYGRMKEAGVDIGPAPETLRDPTPPATGFTVRTLGQNTSLLRQMDHQSETVRRPEAPAATPTSAVDTGSYTVPPAPDPAAEDKAP